MGDTRIGFRHFFRFNFSLKNKWLEIIPIIINRSIKENVDSDDTEPNDTLGNGNPVLIFKKITNKASTNSCATLYL